MTLTAAFDRTLADLTSLEAVQLATARAALAEALAVAGGAT